MPKRKRAVVREPAPAGSEGGSSSSSSSSSAAAAASARTAPAADWRTPVFYWRGSVTGSTWEGTWVASLDGLPADADFASSANTFKLECSCPLATVYEHCEEEVSFTGSYKLDNGDGPEDFSDLEHTINAWEGPPSHHPACHNWANVGAVGNTPFGRFVSLGRLDRPPNPDGTNSGGQSIGGIYTRLTLARRYIAEDDPRNGMSAEDVCRRVIGLGEDEGVINVPWLGLPYQVPDSWPGPLPFDARTYRLINANCEDEGNCDWMIGLGPAV